MAPIVLCVPTRYRTGSSNVSDTYTKGKANGWNHSPDLNRTRPTARTARTTITAKAIAILVDECVSMNRVTRAITSPPRKAAPTLQYQWLSRPFTRAVNRPTIEAIEGDAG